MIVIEFINPETGNTQVIQTGPQVTLEKAEDQIGMLLQGKSSGWVYQDENRTLIIPDKVAERSIIIIREEKDAVSS
jgi:hypothetical protein